MPVVTPTGAPMPRAMLGYDGTDFYVVSTDAAGQLQVDVIASGLPAGAATALLQNTMLALIGALVAPGAGSVNAQLADAVTALQLIDDLRGALTSVWADQLTVMTAVAGLAEAVATESNQTIMITALQLIDNLQAALQSVATDRLIVRGEDQLYSVKGVLATQRDAVISGAGGFIDSDTVPAGELWRITQVYAMDITSATTRHSYATRHDGADRYYCHHTVAFAALDLSNQVCDIWLDAGDLIRVSFTGSLAGDTCRVGVLGHRMTIEV